jgi:hypothetical protein
MVDSLDDRLAGYKYRLASTSYLGLKPGDLISFSYQGDSRYGLIVSSKRTSDGMFLSTRNNTLINVVMITGLSDGMFSLMINNLYENEIACNYHSPRIIGAFLGKQNFRTLNVSKIRRLIRIDIEQ